MKRIFYLILPIFIAFSLCACGTSSSQKESESTVTNKPKETKKFSLDDLMADTKDYEVGEITVAIPSSWKYNEDEDGINFFYPDYYGENTDETTSMFGISCFDEGASEEDFEAFTNGIVEEFDVKSKETITMQSYPCLSVYATKKVDEKTFDVTIYVVNYYNDFYTFMMWVDSSKNYDYSGVLSKIAMDAIQKADEELYNYDETEEYTEKETIEAEEITEEETTKELSIERINALSKAKSYLSVSAFSEKGIIEQLEYEGFSKKDAKYAAKNCGADWTQQALTKAESYLSSSSFSKKGLIEQLEYEGFEKEDAEYAAENCEADWNEQALLKAKSYLESSSFSKQSLTEQLEYEGFTKKQVKYAISKVF